MVIKPSRIDRVMDLRVGNYIFLYAETEFGVKSIKIRQETIKINDFHQIRIMRIIIRIIRIPSVGPSIGRPKEAG